MNGREGELENAPGDVALVSNDADDPWISEFRQKSSTLLDQLCATSLIEHIQYFIRNVNTSVNDCYVKPSKAGKLKEVIKEALLLFSCLYNCEPLKNLSTEEECMKYMEYMSDLLAMYIDMELKASRRGRDLPARITSRIVTSLCIYLNYSEEYMLETLMKIRFMHNLYQHILDPLVSKIFKIIPNPNSGTMYVRHLLLYRLWKKISDKNTKNDINSDASIKLGLPPTDIPAFFLEEVLPRGPILTKFYLMQKFDVKKSSDLFLQFCRKSRGFTNADEVQHIIEEIEIPVVSEVLNNHNSVHIVDDNNLPNLSNNLSNISKSNFSKNASETVEIVRSNTVNTDNSKKEIGSKLNSRNRKNSRKSKEVVLIDITDDDTTKIFRQRPKIKIPWLEELKKNTEKKIHRPEDSTETQKNAWLSYLKSDPNFEADKLVEIIGDTNAQWNEWIEEKLPFESEDVIPPDSSITMSSECIKGVNAEDLCCENDTALETSRNNILCESTAIKATEEETIAAALEEVSMEELGDENGICRSTNSPISSLKTRNVYQEVLSRNHAEENLSFITNDSLAIEDKPDSTMSNMECSSESEMFAAGCSNGLDLPEVEQRSTVLCRSNSISQPAIVDSTTCLTSHSADNSCRYDEDVLNTEDNITKPIITEDVSEIEESQKVQALTTELENSDKFYSEDRIFNDNEGVDGLTLLAIISQQIQDRKSPIIKVREYASLRNTTSDTDTSDSTYDTNVLESPSAIDINRIVGIYPEENTEKQIEVPTAEVDNFITDIKQDVHAIKYIADETLDNNLTMENAGQEQKVILSGETIVLLQKSPNSNLYIINKAVESKSNYNSDDESGAKECDKETQMFKEEAISDSLEKLSFLDNKNFIRNKIKVESDPENLKMNSTDIKQRSPSTEIQASENGEKMSPTKRKSHSYRQGIPNVNSVASHIQQNCAIQNCSGVRPISDSRTIRMNGSHTTPLHGSYSANSELCMPYRQHCSAVPFGLPINSHMHLQAGNSPCLDCNCKQYPVYQQYLHNDSYVEGSPYYIPTHSTIPAPAVQDLKSSKSDVIMAQMYEDQLLCKVVKSMENPERKYESVIKYSECLKLPLKKRYNYNMLPHNNVSIKTEKEESYPGVLMMSIADVEAQNGLSLSNLPELGATEEVISSSKDASYIYQEKQANRKESSKSRQERTTAGVKRAAKTPIEAIAEKIPKKRSRQTRRSKRNVPAVQYAFPDFEFERTVRKRRRK